MKRSIALPAIAAMCLLGLTEAKAKPPIWIIQEQAFTGLATLPGYGPALATLNGTVYVAFTAPCGTRQCVYYSTFNGSSWTARKQHPQAQTGVAPALATFNGQLYLVWAGETSHEIYYSVFNGSSWSEQSKITLNGGGIPVTMDAPALGGFGNNLYLVWSATNSSVSYASLTFGASGWSAASEVPGVPSNTVPAPAQGVALVVSVFGETVAWNGSSDTIFSAGLDGPIVGFNPPIPPNPGPLSSFCPGLVQADQTYIAWANGTGNSPLMFASLDTGTAISVPPTTIGGEGWTAETAAAPAITNLGGVIYIAWSGRLGNIFYTTLTEAVGTPPPHCPCPNCCT